MPTQKDRDAENTVDPHNEANMEAISLDTSRLLYTIYKICIIIQFPKLTRKRVL